MAIIQTALNASYWIAHYVVISLIAMVALLSLLPLIETDRWWIRYLDFARVQLLIALVGLVVLYTFVGRTRSHFGGMLLALGVLAAGYNYYKVYPYIPFWPEEAMEVAACPESSRVRILVANVQKTNEQAQELFDIIRRTNPDLFLVLETDQWWNEKLAQLSNRFSHQVQHIPQGHAFFGIHLFSKYRLIDPEVKLLFDNFTPSIFTGVRLPDGRTVSFYGLHPQPPQSWSQPTTMRDAHLLVAALRAYETQVPSILAGDFNAVPWERVTRRAMRIGSLLDPREGRGLYPTFEVHSILLSWPLDQVLYQDEFALLEFERLPAFGSDHYPILTALCYLPAAADQQSAPALEDGDIRKAQASIEAARNLQPDAN
jgi:endonuclease/exonuclease/phosphatase (EEP) superfamily protein YafD